jgi:cell division protein FtsI/penicillin-binding protein 2
MNGFDSYRLRERADIARIVLIVAFVVLCGAFFRTQVIQHSKFQLKAETNRLRLYSGPPWPHYRRKRARLFREIAGVFD